MPITFLCWRLLARKADELMDVMVAFAGLGKGFRKGADGYGSVVGRGRGRAGT